MSLLSEIVKRLVAVERWIAQHAAFEPTNSTCQVSISQGQTITTATFTYVLYDTDDYDPDDLHSTVANTDRITILVPGVYVISGNVNWDNIADATLRIARINVNGSDLLGGAYGPNLGGGNTDQNTTTQIRLAANDIVRLRVYQTTGGDLDLLKAILNVTRIA